MLEALERAGEEVGSGWGLVVSILGSWLGGCSQGYLNCIALALVIQIALSRG